MPTAMRDWRLVRWIGQPAGLWRGALRMATRSESNSRCRESQFLRRRAYGIFVWAPLARESLGSGGLSMNRTPSSHPSPPGYLFSEMGTPQRGARTVPVRSAWAGRGALDKGDVFGPDNPLRTGTVRGPMQRGPYAAKQIPPPVGEK